MVAGGGNLEQIALEETILPLCVIDKTDAVKKNADYALIKEDILEWEKQYGRIPEKPFVVFKSGWSLCPIDTTDNPDYAGNRYFPE